MHLLIAFFDKAEFNEGVECAAVDATAGAKAFGFLLDFVKGSEGDIVLTAL